MTGTLHEALCTCVIISRWIHRMRNVSDNSCWENRNTHFTVYKYVSFRKSCRLWDNVEKYGRAGQATDDNTRRTRIACWFNAADTHSEHLIVVAFQRQQWFRESRSMLYYTFISSLVLQNTSLPLRTTLSDFANLAEWNCFIQPATKWRNKCFQERKTYVETKVNNSSFETAGNCNPATQHHIAQVLNPQGKHE